MCFRESDSDSSPARGKRISPAKQAVEESSRRREKKKRKKLKKLRIDTAPANFSPEEVEVWTPAMYEKWDRGGRPKTKKRKHKQDSDSDSRQKMKVKPGFNRSLSFDTKKPAQGVQLQRSASSVGTLESLGISHNYGPSAFSRPVSSLPKIPKLKKQEN